MDIFTFAVEFKDEESCRMHYKEQRDKEDEVKLEFFYIVLKEASRVKCGCNRPNIIYI